jgi:hypothetical protein
MIQLRSLVAALLITLSLPSFAAEFAIMNEVITLTSSNNGFFFVYNTNRGPVNWVSPDNFRDGQVYFRYEVLSQPTNTTNHLSFDIWGDYNSTTKTYTESAAPISAALNGPGSVSIFNSQPSTWYPNQNTGSVNWTNRNTFWRWGICHWFSKSPNYLLAPKGWSNSPESWAAWVNNATWLPLQVRVTIVAVSQGSTFSGWSNYLTPGTAPQAPSALSAGNATSQSVQLSWTDNSTNEQGFRIEYRPDANASFTEIATVAANIQSYSHSGLTPNTLYHYRVRAYNATGNSSYTNVADVTTLNGIPPVGGLIARYIFENSVADVSGNGHNGTLVNGAGYSTTQFKEGIRSLLLDGINDYVDIGTLNLGTQFTFASWVYIPSGTSNIRNLIANTTSGASSNGFKISVNTYGTSDRKIILETGNGTQFAHTVTAASTFLFDVWNHVAVTVNKSTGQARIYFNGVNVTFASSLAAGFGTNQATRLGIMTNSTFPMRSNLDDTRIFDIELTAEEVAELAGSGPPPSTIPNAPGSLSATANASSIGLSWVDNSTNEDGFIVERSLTSGSGYGLLNTSAANTTSFNDLSAVVGTTYYYRVRSFNTAGESGNSNFSFATIPVTPSGGLIAHYIFENSAADVSGNGHNGTLVNGATFSTARFKEGIRSLQLDGTNDYVDIGTINLGNQFTFASWVYIPSGSSNIRTLIANTTSGANSNGFKINVNTYGTSDRKIIVETGNGSASGIATSPVSTFVFDSWNHVAVTIDKGSGLARIYYNGVDVTAVSPILTNFNTNAVLRLGIMTNSTFPLKSNLDDTRLYDKILSVSEIAALVGSGPIIIPGNIEYIVMPMGDSFTSDDFTGDSRPAGLKTGYRQNLYLALDEYGYTIDFTGSRRGGFDAIPAFDADHEGHPGYTAATVADSVYHWLSLHPAGIILLQIGTNGLQASTADVEAILDEIDAFEQDNNVEITVILAKIPNRTTYSSLTTTFNNNLEAMANARIGSGDQIVIVDMENDAGLVYQLQPTGDMRDDIHTNQNGYNKMASLWFDNILTVLPPLTSNTPNAPVSLSTTPQSDHIALSWQDESLIEGGYYVERLDPGASVFAVIDTLPRNSNSFDDNTVSSGETYSYRVRAFIGSVNSTYSNTATAIAQSGDPLSFGLIAHYTFENSADDVSGNGNDGILVNGAAFSTSVKEGDFSLVLDGTNDYVDIGTINLGTQFSFATWVYIPTGSSNIRTLIANTISGSSKNGFKISVNQYATTDRKIILETGNGTQSGYALSPVSTFAFDSWNHVAVTADLNTGQANIYYNGANVTSSSAIRTDFATNQALRLGIMTNSVFPLRSNLDDTRIYNRVLSPSDVTSLTSLTTLKAVSGNIHEELPQDADFLTVYPNPFRDKLSISSKLKIRSVEVYTLQGTRVYAQHNVNASELTIHQPDVLNTVYLLRITLENNEVHAVKVFRNE